MPLLAPVMATTFPSIPDMFRSLKMFGAPAAGLQRARNKSRNGKA
jgi:hypothetical protein